MKRSILISLLLLIMLVPLVANTEENTNVAESESLALSSTEESQVITGNEESSTPLELLSEQPPQREEGLSPSKEVVIIPGGNTTVSGVNGYIVIPSAEPVPGGKGTSISTGYSGIFSTDVYAHIPFVQLGFSDLAEVSLAVDIDTKSDLLLNAKWRFSHRNDTSLAVGIVGQLIDVATAKDLAAQLYFASTFSSSIMDFPSKTTVLLGYTFHKDLNTNIDFGIAFQTPFFPSAFKDKVFFLLDFGNVSYSISPSAGDAENRGLVNVGLRMAPLKVLDSVYLTADMRALDLFDHKGRALSLGFTLAFRPD
jgi:hypothetical protein